MDDDDPNANAMSKAKPTTPPKAKGTRPGPAWFSREELAAILDVTVTQVDRRFRAMMPADAVQDIDRRPWFKARALIDAMVEQAEREAATPEAGDPLLTGTGSPALERYREGRADLVELEVAERGGQLIRASVTREALQAGITAMRHAGERLTRKYGNDCGELFREAVDDFQTAALKVVTATPDEKPRKSERPQGQEQNQ